MATYVKTGVTFPQVWSCGVNSTTTLQMTVSGTDYYATPTLKRPKPVGIEQLFSPTYHNKRSGWLKGYPFSARLNHWCWHGNGVYKQAFANVQLPLDVSWTPTIPGYPGGFKTPSDTEMLLLIRDSSLNLAMVAAEYQKTASMFEDIAQSVLRMYRDIRKGKVRKLLARGTKNAPDTWMLYRYGLTPLAYDVEGLVDSIWKLSQTPLVRTFQKSKREELHTRTPLSYDGVPIGDLSTSTMKRCTRRVTVEYLPIQAFTSLGLTNPFLTVYEVIPYSFVLDWFIGVGDYLAAIDALVGVKRYACTATFRGSVRTLWPGGTEGVCRSYERTVTGPLSAEAPRWEPSLTWKRLVDSTILLRNLRN